MLGDRERKVGKREKKKEKNRVFFLFFAQASAIFDIRYSLECGTERRAVQGRLSKHLTERCGLHPLFWGLQLQSIEQKVGFYSNTQTHQS